MFPLLRKTQHEFNIPYPRMKLPTHDTYTSQQGAASFTTFTKNDLMNE